jgi:hypothetical protein
MAENGERQIIDLDLSQPGVKEMAINDRDILMVDESGAAGFMEVSAYPFLEPVSVMLAKINT